MAAPAATDAALGTAADFTDRLARWEQRLQRPTELVLPTDYPRPVPLKVVEASHTFDLPDPACLALLQLSLNQSAGNGTSTSTEADEPASPFTILLAAFAVLMNRYTSEEDVVVGSSSPSGNPLVLRLGVRPEDTFLDVIANVQRVEREAVADEVPFAALLGVLTTASETSQAPSLFRARFFNQTDTTAATLDQTVSSNTDLTVFITQRSTASLRRLLPSVQITLSYNQVLFSPARIHHICDQLIAVLVASARVAQALEAHRTNPALPAPQDAAVGAIDLVTPRCRAVIPDPHANLHWAEWPGAITERFARNARDFPDRRCIVENVLQTAPGSHLAMTSVQRTFTFGKTYAAARLLAVHLLKTGIQREDVVVIYAYRGVDLAVAILGVLMAGATYSVIDPAYPPERQQVYLSVAQPRGLVVLRHAGTLADTVRTYVTEELEIVTEVPALELLTNGRLLGGTISVGHDVLDPHRDLSDAMLLSEGIQVPVPVGPDSIGTLSFTSGSTGIPKGVRGRHYSLTHFYPWMAERFGLGPEDRFTMLSGIAHDPIQRDVFTPFYLGAELHIPTSEDIGIPGQLASWMADHAVTVTHLTPAMGQLLSTNATAAIPSLRNAFFVGDLLTKRSCHRLQHLAENVTVINMFGTTETQRAVSYFAIPSRAQQPSFLSSVKDVIPAGWGMRSVQLLVVNRFHATAADGSAPPPGMCGVGEIGEIYVRSGGLSEGYLRLDDVTSTKFVPNWFDPALRNVDLQAQPYLDPAVNEVPWPFYRGDRDRMYRSGDLGRYLPDGSVECVGRLDDQVKIRGFRIELGEIDNHLSQFPRIRANVTLVRRDKNEEKTLVSYFVPGPVEAFAQGSADPAAAAVEEEEDDDNYARLIADIRAYLKHKLPSYSIPSVFVPLNRLPLTPNGKVDKAALPFPDTALYADRSATARRGSAGAAGDSTTTTAALAAYSATERTLNTIWSEVLDQPGGVIPRDANFFDLGGHSILATRMIFQVRKTFCVDVPLGLVFKQPTIAGMAAEVDRITQVDLNIATAVAKDTGATGESSTADPHKTDSEDDPTGDAGYASDLTALMAQLPPALAFTAASDIASSTNDGGAFEFPARVASGQAPTFFLTGATGFLGAFILAELLVKFPTATVYCLTRGQSDEHAYERVRQSARDHLVWQSDWDMPATVAEHLVGYGSARVRAVRGDLAQPHLGIVDHEWTALASAVDVIIHNGALVHWVYPYAKLRAPNVLGTLAALELAVTDHVKPLHFVSSTSVLDTDYYTTQLGEFKTATAQTSGGDPHPGGNADPSSAITAVLESDDLEGSRTGLHSGYGQSKWVSEKLLFEARARGYPCTVVRPGYVVGATRTGVTNTDDFLWRLVKGCVQLGEVPIMNNAVNMCPVDHVARVVVEAASQPNALALGVFNVANPTRFRYNDFFDQLRIYGFNVDPVAYIPWRNHLMDVTLKSADNALYPLLHFVLDDLPTSTRSPALDRSHTATLCAAGGVPCASMQEVIGLYLAYLVKTGFLPPPAPIDREHDQVELIEDGEEGEGLGDTDCCATNEPSTGTGGSAEVPTTPHRHAQRKPLPDLDVEVGGILNRSGRG
ncbi:large subunit of alpha-aminoadipate reductase [Tieghemiomyces parasiticus]|uniref:Alpha-aminoadipate reductase n=1 Tax=Tieghemiomyces parasiticus TaxID=78921 RepID=A0A9W8AJL0_9FUNG|nr:large subunit of alpha-aminoadipate reductase [Tieghemiomyces parasiticus]